MAARRRTEAAQKKDGECCGADCCEGKGCCGLPTGGSCKVEAIVGVDARGQMVLPKEIRRSFGIGAGDKVAMVVWSSNERACCLTLHPAGALEASLRETYGPLLRGMLKS